VLSPCAMAWPQYRSRVVRGHLHQYYRDSDHVSDELISNLQAQLMMDMARSSESEGSFRPTVTWILLRLKPPSLFQVPVTPILRSSLPPSFASSLPSSDPSSTYSAHRLFHCMISRVSNNNLFQFRSIIFIPAAEVNVSRASTISASRLLFTTY
jgi:hypothetical protein